MVGKTAPILKADKERFEIIVEIGCLPCLLERIHGTPCQVHHATDCGHRIEDEGSEHRYTYGNCLWHHSGELNGTCRGSVQYAEKLYGPSLRLSSRAYHERYGSERELVQVEDALIRIWQAERRVGRYLPPDKLGRLARLLHDEIVHGRSPDPAQVYNL